MSVFCVRPLSLIPDQRAEGIGCEEQTMHTQQQGGNSPLSEAQRARKMGHQTRWHVGRLWQNMPARSRCVFSGCLCSVLICHVIFVPFQLILAQPFFLFFLSCAATADAYSAGYSRHPVSRARLAFRDVPTFHLLPGLFISSDKGERKGPRALGKAHAVQLRGITSLMCGFGPDGRAPCFKWLLRTVNRY